MVLLGDNLTNKYIHHLGKFLEYRNIQKKVIIIIIIDNTVPGSSCSRKWEGYPRNQSFLLALDPGRGRGFRPPPDTPF